MTGLGNDFPRRKSRRGRLNRIQTSAAHFAYWITRVSRSLADIPQLQHPAARKWSHRPGISLSSEPRPPPCPPRRRGRGGGNGSSKILPMPRYFHFHARVISYRALCGRPIEESEDLAIYCGYGERSRPSRTIRPRAEISANESLKLLDGTRRWGSFHRGLIRNAARQVASALLSAQ